MIHYLLYKFYQVDDETIHKIGNLHYFNPITRWSMYTSYILFASHTGIDCQVEHIQR